jgi:hypothetical protein
VPDVVVEGDPAQQMAKLARDLKAAGAVELRKELNAGIRGAAKPLIKEAKDNAALELPHGGEALAMGGKGVRRGKRRRSSGSVVDRVVGATFSTRILTGRNPGVVLRGRDKAGRSIDLRSLDAGRLRHPLFGNRKHWYQQSVKPNWWTEPMEKGIPRAYAAVVLAVTRVNNKFR